MRVGEQVDAAELNQQGRLTDPGGGRPAAIGLQKMRIVAGQREIVIRRRRDFSPKPLPPPAEKVAEVLVMVSANSFPPGSLTGKAHHSRQSGA